MSAPGLPEDHPADVKRRMAAVGFPLIVVVAVAVAFSPVVGHELLPWDDFENIVRNPNLQPPLMTGLARIWSAPYDGLYAPLPYTTWWLERLAGGGAALSHGVNLALHGLCGGMVYLLLCTLGRALGWARVELPALMGALIFCLHPLQTEAVAWATGRKDLLAGLFSLAALWQYVRWRVTDSRFSYFAAMGLFVLALLAKPSAVAVPLVTLVIDHVIFRKPIAGTVLASAPFLVLGVLWGVLTAEVQKSAGAGPVDFKTPEVSAVGRLLVAADSLLFYGWKAVWPVELSPVYDRSVAHSQGASGWIAVAALLALVAYVVWLNKPWTAGVLIFLVALLPVSGLVPFHYQAISTVADRYAYLALVGLALLTGVAAHRWRWTTPVVGAVAVAFAVLSFMQARHWRDSLSLWSRAYQIAPGNAAAHNNLGLSLGDAARPAEAQRHLEAAVKLKPDYAMAHNNLGALYLQMGRNDEALRNFEQAVKLSPNLVTAHSALLAAYFEQGRSVDAANSARVVLRHDPNHYQALAVLASVLGNEGRIEEALKLLRDAAARRPQDSDLQQLLKSAEAIAGQS